MEDNSETPTTAILPSEVLTRAKSLQAQRRHTFTELPQDILVALADIASRPDLWMPDYKPKIRIWLPPNAQQQYIPKQIVYYEQPIGVCTCPDGLRWFGSIRGRRDPYPMPDNGRWKIALDCPWCSYPDGVYWQKAVWVGFPWRHIMKAGLTVLCGDPYVPWVGFHRRRAEIDEAIMHFDASSVPSEYEEVVKDVTKGRRIDPDDAHKALKPMRTEHAYLNLEVIEAKLAGISPNPRYEAQAIGWRAIIAATECAAYYPEMRKTDGCWRLPVVPDWKSKRVSGQFMGLQGSGREWSRWLAGFGVEF